MGCRNWKQINEYLDRPMDLRELESLIKCEGDYLTYLNGELSEKGFSNINVVFQMIPIKMNFTIKRKMSIK